MSQKKILKKIDTLTNVIKANRRDQIISPECINAINAANLKIIELIKFIK